jgi:hypothetical protein
MTAGPVTAHVPIDHGPAQRQLTDTPGESGGDSATSFADLLASMLAPGAPGAQLPGPAANAAEAVMGRLDAAEVFNETGLFRGAAPLPAAEAPPGGEPAAAQAAAVWRPGAGPRTDLQPLSAGLGPDPLSPAAAAGPASASAAAEGRAGSAASRVAGAASKAATGALASLRGQAVAGPASAPQSAAFEPEAASVGKVSPRSAAMVARLLAARAGAAAAQVSVQAVESGISVMARVDRLSREERDRLRGQIGELLARHGFAGAEILLNGEAWPQPQGKED